MKSKNLIKDLTSDEKRDLIEAARIAYALPGKMEELIDGMIRERENGSSVPHFNPLLED